MHFFILILLFCCIGTSDGADFYDFRKGPDGGVFHPEGVEDKITDFVNVPDKTLITETKRAIKGVIILKPEEVQFQDIKVVRDVDDKKVACGKISTLSISGERGEFRPFSYGEHGINMLRRTGYENSSGKIGDQLRQREKAWKERYKALGC